MSPATYDRLFAGHSVRNFPFGQPTGGALIDPETGLVIPLENQVWRLDEQRLHIDTFIAALQTSRGQLSIRPPTTGDAGLKR
jgi:hypothetical protein